VAQEDDDAFSDYGRNIKLAVIQDPGLASSSKPPVGTVCPKLLVHPSVHSTVMVFFYELLQNWTRTVEVACPNEAQTVERHWGICKVHGYTWVSTYSCACLKSVKRCMIEE
jgi:hypothetical protein